jgi:hypothetical protein
MAFDLNKVLENLKERGDALASFGKSNEDKDTDERSSRVEEYDDFLKDYKSYRSMVQTADQKAVAGIDDTSITESS